MSLLALRWISALALAAGSLVALTPPAQAASDRSQGRGQRAVCEVAQPGHASCNARVVTHAKPGGGTPTVTNPVPKGFTPAQVRSAYNLPPAAAKPVTIAIIGAHHNPRIKADLDVFTQQFGMATLPTCTSTITTRCLQIVDQNGGTRFPRTFNDAWALEGALDVQAAHLVCPNCKILLIEATTSSYVNLFAAVDRAVAMGATVVSMSFGGAEFASQSAYNKHFDVPGVAFTASTGDGGAATQYPAASPYVTAVGGTSLTLDSSGNWASETVWNGTGGGCSRYEEKPTWQQDTGCSKRTIADVAAVADAYTGVAIYSSNTYMGQSGWFSMGGTSLSAPLIAGVYALGGVPTGVRASALPYANAASLHDVVAGSNGTCGTYLCNGAPGYDSPTGLGTPNGVAAF